MTINDLEKSEDPVPVQDNQVKQVKEEKVDDGEVVTDVLLDVVNVVDLANLEIIDVSGVDEIVVKTEPMDHDQAEQIF